MISTKGRYALRFLCDLAAQDPDAYIPLKDSSARQGISRKYLEAIAKELVAAGFLNSASGKKGGYRLAADPQDINVYEVLQAMEGSMAPVACLECSVNSCDRQDICPTLPMWQKFDELTRDYFSNIQLSDLMERKV